jgi:hypothetical protein
MFVNVNFKIPREDLNKFTNFVMGTYQEDLIALEISN